MSVHTPGSLLAVFEQLSDLYAEYHQAETEATNAPRSEQEDARGLADERKDEVLQYISHLLGGGA